MGSKTGRPRTEKSVPWTIAKVPPLRNEKNPSLYHKSACALGNSDMSDNWHIPEMSLFRLPQGDYWKTLSWSELSAPNGSRAKGHYFPYQRAILGIHPSHQIGSEEGSKSVPRVEKSLIAPPSLLRKKGPFLTPFFDPSKFYRR